MAKFAKIVQENNEFFLIKKFIRLFRSKIDKSAKTRFSFVLTGGRSPIKLYKQLAKDKKIPWRKIDFFIGDERFVKETSKYSNIRMCKKYLLNRINISDKQIYNINTNFNSLKQSALDYEKKIVYKKTNSCIYRAVIRGDPTFIKKINILITKIRLAYISSILYLTNTLP